MRGLDKAGTLWLSRHKIKDTSVGLMKAGTEMSFSAALSGLQEEAMSRERGRKKGEDRN